MSRAHTNDALISGRVGSGVAAPDAAGWLSLAAAPTFAVMALWTGLTGAQPDVLCIGVRNVLPLDGMPLMYALMSIFHAVPWLRLLSSARFGVRRS
jgi:hypothetical protein